MLHTLVLLVQFVGDHATYLGTSGTVCWRPCYILWYFSYSLLATMLHTLVLFVQFVGDHATYLGTSHTVCGRPCYILWYFSYSLWVTMLHTLVLLVVCWQPRYIPWYFSYSLWATMLHTLVLLVQFVGDHATYLGTSRTACWRPCRPWSTCWGDMIYIRSSSGCSTSSSHFRCTSADLGPLSITKTSSHSRVKPRCLYSHHCEQTLTTVHKLRT